MKNKKGFTLVELLVSFALITTISLAFFRTILSIQQKQLLNIAKNNYKAFTVVMNNYIQKDFMNDRIEKVISCGNNCYDITYTTNGIVRLSVDKENNAIVYGNFKEKIPTDYKLIGDIKFISYISDIKGIDSYIALNINLKSNYENKIENIKYVYQYDVSEGIIELKIDGASASDTIEYLLYSEPEDNGLYEPLLPDGTSTGIRYRGENPNNYVYYNCEDTDSAGVAYGDAEYNYASSCEIWRIIGVFDTKEDKTDAEGTLRIKIINTNSTFKASWDSSGSQMNNGWGVNQWGQSIYKNKNGEEETYSGADLMQLLNGYYIGKSTTCEYNLAESGQSGFAQTCTKEQITSAKMKPLTSIAKAMITSVVWDIYAVKWPEDNVIDLVFASTAYLQERGITNKYTGCLDTEIEECKTDNVIRDNKWVGLIGLMTVSDIVYANGWLYSVDLLPWTITPRSFDSRSNNVWRNGRSYPVTVGADGWGIVWPTTYLSPNIKIMGGDGSLENAYRLGL